MTKAIELVKDYTQIKGAHELVNYIIECRIEITKYLFIIGYCFKTLKDEELYKHYDTDISWPEFCSQLGCSKSTAYNYIELYDFYIQAQGYKPEELLDIGYTKLVRLLPYCRKHTSETDDLIESARGWSESDVINEVRRRSGKEPMQPQKALNTALERRPLAKDYGEYVTQHPCIICGATPPSERAPWPLTEKMGGRFTIPLCYNCHIGDLHHDGVDTFMATYKRKIEKYLASLVGILFQKEE